MKNVIKNVLLLIGFMCVAGNVHAMQVNVKPKPNENKDLVTPGSGDITTGLASLSLGPNYPELFRAACAQACKDNDFSPVTKLLKQPSIVKPIILETITEYSEKNEKLAQHLQRACNLLTCDIAQLPVSIQQNHILELTCIKRRFMEAALNGHVDDVKQLAIKFTQIFDGTFLIITLRETTAKKMQSKIGQSEFDQVIAKVNAMITQKIPQHERTEIEDALDLQSFNAGQARAEALRQKRQAQTLPEIVVKNNAGNKNKAQSGACAIL